MKADVAHHGRSRMIYLLTLIAVASRFLPHPPNFACIGALGLFAGCYLASRRAYLIPVGALLASDIVGQFFSIPGMGFYRPEQMAFVYLGMALSVMLGRHLRDRQSGSLRWKALPLAAISASSLFFVLSNLGVWLGPWYPTDASGLIACFAAAIPFYGYTLAGDCFFAGVMFGAMELSHAMDGSKEISVSTAPTR